MNHFKNMLQLLFGFSLIFCTVLSCTNTPNNDTTLNKIVKQEKPTDPQWVNGKQLFMDNCASCHHSKMVNDLVGPALIGVDERWEKREDLIAFIQDPQQLINDNHPRAVEIAALWPSEMTSSTHLKNEDVEDILKYIRSY